MIKKIHCIELKRSELSLKETRGKSSYAIINALKDVEKRINSSKKENIFEAVSKAKNAYFEQNDKNIKNIILYTERLIGNHQSVLLFDYSSTVEKAICALKNKIDVYIPESRVIAGGFPYVKKNYGKRASSAFYS